MKTRPRPLSDKELAPAVGGVLGYCECGDCVTCKRQRTRLDPT